MLYDQHAFVEVEEDTTSRPFKVGGVVEFGISHPCTCIDRHGATWELDEAQEVVGALETVCG